MRRVDCVFTKIVALPNLFLAAKKAVRKKIKSVQSAGFYFNFEKEILQLHSELSLDYYRPKPYRIFKIYEPKERVICSSHVRDRVVHHAICRQIEPYFERRFIFDSYACRMGKGGHAAIAKCQHFARRSAFFLKLDIRKHFETIDHAVLKSLLRRMFKDKRLHDLLGIIIDHQVPQYPKGKGLPIGNLTSQFFANLYLDQLDHFLKEDQRIRAYLRYMDDFLIFGDDKEVLWELYLAVKDFVQRILLLELKDEVTMVASVKEGIPFLGFRVFNSLAAVKSCSNESKN